MIKEAKIQPHNRLLGICGEKKKKRKKPKRELYSGMKRLPRYVQVKKPQMQNMG